MTLRIKEPKTTYQFKKGSPNSKAKIAAAAKKAKRGKVEK